MIHFLSHFTTLVFEELSKSLALFRSFETQSWDIKGSMDGGLEGTSCHENLENISDEEIRL